MIGLTPQQRDMLLALQELTDELGRPPSLEALRERCGMCSRGNVSARLAALEERGWIRRAKGRPGALAILKRLEPEEPEIVGLFDAPEIFSAGDLAMIATFEEERRKEGT